MKVRKRRLVALLRGVNVGGHNVLRMAELRDAAASIGLENPHTHLQSGNLVFEAAGTSRELSGRIGTLLRETFGIGTPVILRTRRDLAEVVEANPFDGEGLDPARLLVAFLARAPCLEVLEDLESPATGREELVFDGKHVYLSCPDGLARSKLSNAWFESALKMPATVRNWKTVEALHGVLMNGR